MSTIKILYPQDDYVLYDTELNFRFSVERDLFKKIVLSLNDYAPIKLNHENGEYVFKDLKEGENQIVIYAETLKGVKIENTEKQIKFNVISTKFNAPNKNWEYIKEKLPQFIREDHKTFTRFIEAYYEWLQTTNNPVYSVFNTEYFSDIDTTPDLFLKSFRSQYLNDFPKNILDLENVNLKTVIKNIKSFYGSKGTEKSFKFLFRLLYNSYIEIYYPRKDLLVASGDLWVENTKIRIRGIDWKNANKIKGSLLYQNDSTGKIISSARIRDVKSYKVNTEDIFELYLDNLIGVFDLYDPVRTLIDYLQDSYSYIGEKVYIDIIDGKEVIPFQVYMINGISDISITSPGLNVGETIVVVPNPTSKSTGNSFSAVISSVDSFGIPTSISIMNHGYDYRGSETSFVIQRKNPDNTFENLNGTIKIQKIMRETGYYETKKSAPSSGGIIRDNRKYQEMSYVIKTILPESQYLDTIKKLAHPSGFGVFNDILFKINSVIDSGSSGYVNRWNVPYIGNYIAYKFKTKKNLRNDIYQYGDYTIYPDGLKDLYPNGFDPTATIPDEIYATVEHVPTSYDSIIKDGVKYTQFTYLPDVIDINKANEYWVVYPHPNSISYADEQLNTPVGNPMSNKAFMDIKIKDFLKFFIGRIDITDND